MHNSLKLKIQVSAYSLSAISMLYLTLMYVRIFCAQFLLKLTSTYPIAFRAAKTLWSFSSYECYRVKEQSEQSQHSWKWPNCTFSFLPDSVSFIIIQSSILLTSIFIYISNTKLNVLRIIICLRKSEVTIGRILKIWQSMAYTVCHASIPMTS